MVKNRCYLCVKSVLFLRNKRSLNENQKREQTKVPLPLLRPCPHIHTGIDLAAGRDFRVAGETALAQAG